MARNAVIIPPHAFATFAIFGYIMGRTDASQYLGMFYLPDAGEWGMVVARLEKAGYKSVKSFNPYWDKKGKTFEDPDGYRVVLQNASW